MSKEVSSARALLSAGAVFSTGWHSPDLWGLKGVRTPTRKDGAR